MSKSQPIGALYLIKKSELRMIGRLRCESFAAGSRRTKEKDGFRQEFYRQNQAPSPEDIRGHFRFHLRFEIPNFEFMCRFFEAIGADFVQQWIEDEPTGIYARRTGFFYEFFIGEGILKLPSIPNRNYDLALDDKKILCASPDKIRKNIRWKILDNMPGNRFFCPSLAKNEAFALAQSLDIPQMLEGIKTEFGEEMLMRAANWMTIKESRASFEIEHEAQNQNRIMRFASVLAKRTGDGDKPPLSHTALAALQKDIIGKDSVLEAFGIRKSPVFVGRSGYEDPEERVEYIAPPFEDLEEMLTGIEVFLERTSGQNAIMRAAIAAFGFVYIHPLSDGNGRTHRFLIQDILCRDGILNKGFILPLSAVINADSIMRQRYDAVLEELSKPLMKKIRPFVSFTPQYQKYADNIESNLEFTGNDIARPAWRYPKMEPHVGFLARTLQKSIADYLYNEVAFLRRQDSGREAIKEILEMPDNMADRILRAFQDHPEVPFGKKLLKEIPALSEKQRAEKIHKSLTQVWKENPLKEEDHTKIFKP